MVYLKRTLYKLYSFVFIDLIILMELTALTIIQAFGSKSLRRKT
jgi:hypothetical protein